jgi:hypothetical protein
VDVAAWLRALTPQKYEEAFRSNEIDARVLPRLLQIGFIPLAKINECLSDFANDKPFGGNLA